MVQPSADKPVAQAVPEVAAGYGGGYAARKAACGYGNRRRPLLGVYFRLADARGYAAYGGAHRARGGEAAASNVVCVVFRHGSYVLLFKPLK